MATATLPKKNINYWRIGILLLDIGTPVLRKLLENKVSSENQNDINDFFRNEDNKRKLRRLDSRVLPKESRDKLYPPNDENVNIQSWDITLLCAVLKEIGNLSADGLTRVDELRKIRNEEFAHNPSASLEEDEFERIWSHISAAIEGILVVINDSAFTESMRAKVLHWKDCDLQKSDIDQAKSVMETKWKEEIQEHLIAQYHNYNTILPVAPLYDDEGLRISELYTNVVLYENSRLGRDLSLNHEDNQINSYQEIFQRKNSGEPVKLILLKGPAGRGKSSYCVRMANVWASAMEKRRSGLDVLFTDDENEMLKYDFVFFLALRFSNGVDSAFEMVKSQLFEEAPHFAENLEKCFRNGNCLLILDGLDEWSPGTERALPSTEKLNFCTRIISTRPWKLQSIPSNLNIRVIDIGIMDENAIRTLATKILANYYRVSVSNQERMVNNFMHALKKHSLDSMAEIPLILTYLVCLWKDENGLEESKTVNYGGLLESLIRYVKTQLTARGNRTLPGSLSFRPNCCRYSNMLYKLAEFAFQSTVGLDQPKLVFNKAALDAHFNDAEEIKFCLDNGLLSQSKAPGCRANNNVIVQFFHKSVQEFLVALYVAMSPPDCMTKLQQQLTSIDKILSMSTILIFICGLRPQFCNKLTTTIAKVADKSPAIQKYRNSLEGRFSFRKSRSLTSYRTVKDIQGLVLQCTKECSYNKRFAGAVKTPVLVSFGTIFPGGTWRVKPTLYDFVVKETTEEDVIILLEANSKDLQSLYIDSPARKMVRQLSNEIQKAKKLHRLHLDQVSSGLIFDLRPETLANLRSLSLVLDNISQFPANMTVLKHLRALSLCISAIHPVIEDLMDYFQEADKLEEIDIEKVKCVTHRGDHRCNLSLNMASNDCLKKLSVQELSAKEVVLSLSVDLEEVWLSGWMSNPSAVVSSLPASNALTTLILGDLFAFNCFRWTPEDIGLITQVLPQLENLNHLHLLGISFGEDSPLLSSNADHLESISVEDVSLHDRGWIMFLRSLIDIRHSISCFITTKEDAYPIQIIRQVSPEHFTNVNISVSRNRAVIKFETTTTELVYSIDHPQEDDDVVCKCAIHQFVVDGN